MINISCLLKQLKKVWNSFSIAIILVASLWLLRQLDLQMIISLFPKVNLFYLIPLSVLYPISIGLSTLRWRLFTKKSASIRFLELFKLYWKSSAISQVFPGSYSGDLLKYSQLKSSLGKSSSISSIFLERYSGFVVLISIALVSIITYPKLFETTISVWWKYILVVLLFGIMFTPPLADLIYKKLVKKSCTIPLNIWLTSRWWSSLALSSIFVMSNVLSMYFAFRIFGVELNLYILAALVPIVNLSGVLPLPLNGLGVKEGIAVLLFTQLEIHPEVIIGVFVITRLLRITLDMVAVIVLSLINLDTNQFSFKQNKSV